MRRLVADSGSTKTDWQWAEEQKVSTIGLNPMILSQDDMLTSLQKELIPKLESQNAYFDELYFYGAGCAGDEALQKMEQTLARALQKFVQKIYVFSDIWAAIRATCGASSGFCAILGTGSNSCLYDADTDSISAQIPALGYLLGDEGGGYTLGRAVLQAFFYRQMPDNLARQFVQAFPQVSQSDFLAQIYASLRPNQAIAQFARFLADHAQDEFAQSLVRHNFDQFFQHRLLAYPQIHQLPLHFVGSIAAVWAQELRQVAHKYKINIGNIIASPFPNLWSYHQFIANTL
jgi:glucosamine kinase